MKKIFLSTLFIAGAAIAMTSCNNGNYDADPNTNNSNVTNPWNNNNGNNGNGGGNNGGSVTLGTMKAKINGTEINFSNPAIATNVFGNLGITGNTASPPDFDQLTIGVAGYTTPKVYEGTGFSNLTLIYGKYQGNALTATYSNSTSATNHVKIEVTDDSNGNFKGTFEGTVFYAAPGSPNTSDSIIITDGVFYVKKTG